VCDSLLKEAAGDFLSQGNQAGVGTRIGALLQSVKQCLQVLGTHLGGAG